MRSRSPSTLQEPGILRRGSHSRILRKLAGIDSYFNELRYPTELVKVEGLGQEEGSILDELASVVRSYAAGGG